MAAEHSSLDALDVRLVGALRNNPRAGYLELSRLTHVSRATVQARMNRLENEQIITGFGPELNLPRTGYPVLAFVRLSIAQGGLDTVGQGLAAIPEVLEADGTTGPSDIECRVAATSNDDLQRILIDINRLSGVVRSTSVIALRRIIEPRYLPLLESRGRPEPRRVRRHP